MRRLPFPPCFTLTKPGSAQRFVARVKENSLWLKLAQASVLLAVFGSRREFWS